MKEKVIRFLRSRREGKAVYILTGAIIALSLLFLFQHIIYGGIGIPVFVSISPKDEVPLKTNFTFDFSSPVVKDSRVNKFYDREENIVFTPKIAGKYKWVSNRNLRFYSYSELKGATNYSVEVRSEICTLKNKSLKGKKGFTFNTLPLTIVDSRSNYVYVDFPKLKKSLEWNINFNYEVMPEDLRKHTFISMKKLLSSPQKIDYKIEPQEGKSANFKIITEPIEISRDKLEVALKITKGLKPAEGELGLRVDWLDSHTIEDKLKVYEVYSQSDLSWIRIRFSSAIAVNLAKEYIKVKPEVKFDIEQQGTELILKGDFKLGNWYEVTILKELVGEDGTYLDKTFTQNVRINDLEPSLEFEHKGKYLMRKGELNLAVKSANIKKILIEVKLIFANNVVHLLKTCPEEYDEYEYYYDYDYGRAILSKKIYSEEINLEGNENKITKTIFNMEKFIGTKRNGIFNVVVRDSEDMWRRDGITVIITDLGIIAKKSDNQLFVWINSLKNLEPTSGVNIKLISGDNQVLAEGVTQHDGVCVIENLKEKVEDFEPFIIVAEKGNDFSFLKFSDCVLPTHYFDIGGDEYVTDGYQAFLYTDRGVYRPDDKVNLVAVTRGKEGSLPEKFPVILKVFDPLNRLFKEFKGNLNEQGAVDFELRIPNYATTGRYAARLFVAENEIGQNSFLVEEFIPDRIKVKIKTDKSEYITGEKVKLDVEGLYLFGPPASGKRTSGLCKIENWSFIPKDWAMYSFGDANKGFQDITLNFKEDILDENGKHTYELEIPKDIRPPMALVGKIQVQVIEEGGRAVTEQTTIKIYPYPYFIGLRSMTPDYAEIGKEYKLNYVVVDKNGKEVKPDLLKVNVYRIVWQSILKKDDGGYYRWVSEQNEQLVKTLDLRSEDVREIKYIPQEYGEYKIIVEEPNSGASSSLYFYASGWGYAPWSLSNPDRIKLDLDKKDYKPGETAKLQIKAPFAGKLLLTVEREKVLSYRTFELKENTALIELPVNEIHSPNVYICATIIKELKPDQEVTPIRAFGIISLQVTPLPKKLNIKLKCPDVIRPNTDLSIEISTDKPNAYLTVMAVDEGICQLTAFQTPDIFNFFYGKKRLSLSSYDIYSYILPEIKKPLKSGGGAVRKHLMPLSVQRVKPVSLYSGILKTDRQGKTYLQFKIPQFQGQLRIMVVSFMNNCVNSTERAVKVRDPIVLLPTLPRVLTGNDIFKLPVGVYNGTKKDGKIKVALKTNELVDVMGEKTKEIFVKAGKEEYIYFDLKAEEKMGKVTFRIDAEGMGEKTYYEEELALRPASPAITLTGSGDIKPEKSLGIELPGGWIRATEDCKLILNTFPNVKLSGSLQYLLKYPHGCIEQTTSSVFPLLYFKDLARQLEPDLFKSNSADYYIMEGIYKLQRMQLDNGAFSFWPEGGYVNEWGSIYASHFLVEAKKAEYPVGKELYAKVLNYLNGFVTRPHRNNWELEQKVYACYVLALSKEPNKSTMNFIKEYKLKELSAYSRFQLAGAFAHSGDLRSAKEILPTEINPQKGNPQDTGNNFYSDVRTNAIMLDILVEIFPESPAIPVLVNSLFASGDKTLGRWYTTQENAFALLALGKAFKKFKKAKFEGAIRLNGKIYKEFSEKGLTIEESKLAGKKIEIEIKGEGNCFYYWQVWGIKKGEAFPEYEKGINLSRVYLDRNGKKIDIDRLKQGDIIVVKISAKAEKENLQNVIICDMLPSGLEIENPRLSARATIPWVEEQAKADYLDMRDDRLLLYTTLSYNNWTTFYYTLRVVTEGEFILPPVSAECMYNPNYTAVKSSGRIRVIK
ncbi:MAG: MG2 domain-containing protein [bacterium]|nr:MG2 domain-containing protein [bacterium]